MNKGIRKCKGEEGATTVNNDWNCSVLDQLRIKKVNGTLKTAMKTIFKVNTMPSNDFTLFLDIA